MALIRQAEFAMAGRDAIVLDLGDLARQAERLREAARVEAEQMASQARAERERILSGAAEEGRRQGHEEGLSRGREEGMKAGREAALADARERLAALEASWTKALEAFDTERERMLQEARHDVLRLAVAVAEKVVKRSIVLHEATAVDQLAAALTLVSRATRLSVAVHPEDREPVREALPELLGRLASGAHVDLVDDAALHRGSCVIRTASGGEIDASIGSQLDRIVEVLLPGGGRLIEPAPAASTPEAPSKAEAAPRRTRKRP